MNTVPVILQFSRTRLREAEDASSLTIDGLAPVIVPPAIILDGFKLCKNSIVPAADTEKEEDDIEQVFFHIKVFIFFSANPPASG